MVTRNFYEDDKLIETTPGKNIEIKDELKEKESSHGNISFVRGMGIRTTESLEKSFHTLRQQLNHHLSVYSAEFSTQQSSLANEYDNIKTKFTEAIKEPLLPSSIYVLTAALSGSVFSSKRNIPLRFVTPILFGGIAFRYFMPYTCKEVQGKLLQTEKKYTPEVFSWQDEYIKKASLLKERACRKSQEWNQELIRGVHQTRVTIQDIFSQEK